MLSTEVPMLMKDYWTPFLFLDVFDCLTIVQEFNILPVGAFSFKEALKMRVEVYHQLKAVIKKKYGQDAINVGDEGAFAPSIQKNKEGLELLKTTIAKAGYIGKVVIGMDVAASEFYDDKNKTYDLNFKEENNDGSQRISCNSLKNVYKSFMTDYPIVSIEDPFDQDDWEHYAKMTTEIGGQVLMISWLQIPSVWRRQLRRSPIMLFY